MALNKYNTEKKYIIFFSLVGTLFLLIAIFLAIVLGVDGFIQDAKDYQIFYSILIGIFGFLSAFSFMYALLTYSKNIRLKSWRGNTMLTYFFFVSLILFGVFIGLFTGSILDISDEDSKTVVPGMEGNKTGCIIAIASLSVIFAVIVSIIFYLYYKNTTQEQTSDTSYQKTEPSGITGSQKLNKAKDLMKELDSFTYKSPNKPITEVQEKLKEKCLEKYTDQLKGEEKSDKEIEEKVSELNKSFENSFNDFNDLESFFNRYGEFNEENKDFILDDVYYIYDTNKNSIQRIKDKNKMEELSKKVEETKEKIIKDKSQVLNDSKIREYIEEVENFLIELYSSCIPSRDTSGHFKAKKDSLDETFVANAKKALNYYLKNNMDDFNLYVGMLSTQLSTTGGIKKEDKAEAKNLLDRIESLKA